MNLANKLTLARVAVIPLFVLAMALDGYLWALVLFALASLTDMLDGKIARKYNMITDFGKFLDPLADKMLVAAALVCFVELRWTAAWVVILILMREFAVSGVRLVAASGSEKLVIPASIWGKLKTASTMVAIAVMLFLAALKYDFGIIGQDFPVQIINDVLMYISAVLTVISGIKYLWDYRSVLRG